MTKEKKLVLLLLIILLAFGVLVVFVFDINCLFKTIFDFPCPGCGLTRGFRQLFQGNVLEATKYNLLTVPIFLFLSLLCILFIIDLIKKTNYMEKYLFIFKKYYILVILFVLISYVINILKIF